MINKVLFLLFFAAAINVQAQQRYQSEIFSSIDSVTNIEYGQALNIKGNKEKLLLDIYMPTAQMDTIKKRPVLLFIHGGGFQKMELRAQCRQFVSVFVCLRQSFGCPGDM